MFKHLDKYKVIAVVSPQRSGTRIASVMIAHDTGHNIIHEYQYDFTNSEILIKENNNTVYHAPGLTHKIKELDDAGIAVVVIRRNTDDIQASEKRIKWQGQNQERRYFDNKPDKPISIIKYEFIDSLKDELQNYYEFSYTDLEKHPLYKPKEERKNFQWNQWE